MSENNSEETGFVVRDRRRFTGDTPQAIETTPEAPPALLLDSPTDNELPVDVDADNFQELEESIQELYGAEGETALPDVYSLLALFLGELRNLSIVLLGLAPNPMTGQMAGDLAQAKIAIDTITFLAGQLEMVVAPEEQLPLKALVSDLQIAFVEQTRRASGAWTEN